jgi:hypothetical protein
MTEANNRMFVVFGFRDSRSVRIWLVSAGIVGVRVMVPVGLGWVSLWHPYLCCLPSERDRGRQIASINTANGNLELQEGIPLQAPAGMKWNHTSSPYQVRQMDSKLMLVPVA